MELESKVYDKIQELCSCGDNLVTEALYDEAILKYQEALSFVPDNKNEWEASTWIYAALGDTCFLKRDFDKAKNYMYDALNCPGGVGNPFISLRLGECLAELGETDKSKSYLLRAYMLEGDAIFQGEDEKYFEMIKAEM
jgi:tetratricopeptide (TPR) repeat protein